MIPAKTIEVGDPLVGLYFVEAHQNPTYCLRFGKVLARIPTQGSEIVYLIHCYRMPRGKWGSKIEGWHELSHVRLYANRSEAAKVAFDLTDEEDRDPDMLARLETEKESV